MEKPEQTPTLVLKKKENEAENTTETNMLFDDMPDDFEWFMTEYKIWN